MSWLSSWLHPEKAYDKAQDQISQASAEAQQFQMPFYQQGIAAGQQLNPVLDALLNPEALEAKWAEGYETSPQARQAMAQAKEEGLGAASSMGLMGSSPALQAIQAGASNIAARDRDKYMQDLMQKYMVGIGLGQNLYGIGAQAGGMLGNRAMQTGEDLAQLGIAGQQARAGRFGDILGGLGQLGISYLTGGFGKGAFGRGMFQ